jgi:hypothetical protein
VDDPLLRIGKKEYRDAGKDAQRQAPKELRLKREIVNHHRRRNEGLRKAAKQMLAFRRRIKASMSNGAGAPKKYHARMPPQGTELPIPTFLRKLKPSAN